MISKNFKVLVDNDGKEYRFNHFNFRNCIRGYCTEKKKQGVKVTQEEVRDNLCEHVHVSSDAARNWMYGYNGPAEMQIVKDMATYLNVDYRILLMSKEQENMNTNTTIEKDIINETAVNAIKRIYASIVSMAEELPKMMEAIEFNAYDDCEDYDGTPEGYTLYDGLAVYESLKLVIRYEMLNIPEKLFWDLIKYCEDKFGVFFEMDGYKTILEKQYEEYCKENDYPNDSENGDPFEVGVIHYEFQKAYQDSVYTDMNKLLRPYIESNYNL